MSNEQESNHEVSKTQSHKVLSLCPGDLVSYYPAGCGKKYGLLQEVKYFWDTDNTDASRTDSHGKNH